MNVARMFAFACSLLVVPLAVAQAPNQPPPPPGQFGPPHGLMGRRGNGLSLGIAPMGMWWKDPGTIAAVGLTMDQQKHLDEIFQQSRPQLMQMKAALEDEQMKLRPMLDAGNIDQNAAYAEISKIADLRAELEKANAKMLLGLRSMLTAEQWTKLQADRRMHREGPEGFRDRRGPEAQGTPPAPGGSE